MIKYRTLFLIEDDEDDQLLFSDAIFEIDPSLRWHVANNGIEAFQKLKHHEFRPDIIFLDLNMPLMNGFEFLVEFQKYPHNIPIVIFSTSNSPEHALRTHQLGANAFLTKPPSYNILKLKLVEILNTDFTISGKTFQLSEYLI